MNLIAGILMLTALNNGGTAVVLGVIWIVLGLMTTPTFWALAKAADTDKLKG